jgi:hypothetical protein
MGRRALLVVLVVLSLGAVVFLGLAWPAKASAVFTGATLVAASLAVWYARPAYVEWRKQQKSPDVSLKLFVGPPNRGKMDEVTGGEIEWGGPFALRVAVENPGPATVRWGILNVVVPAGCMIVPHHEGYHAAEWPDFNDEIVPGENVSVRYGYVERDFPPGHVYKYDAVMRVGLGELPVLVVLSGHPSVRAVARCTVHVTER